MIVVIEVCLRGVVKPVHRCPTECLRSLTHIDMHQVYHDLFGLVKVRECLVFVLEPKVIHDHHFGSTEVVFEVNEVLVDILDAQVNPPVRVLLAEVDTNLLQGLSILGQRVVIGVNTHDRESLFKRSSERVSLPVGVPGE